jgi:hypothetical protein
MTLKILGLEVPVTIEHIENSSLAGYYDFETHKIVISKDDKHKFATMAHEMFHAAWNRCGFNQAGIPHSVQEIIVEQFSVVLAENFDQIVKFRKSIDKK